MRWTLKPSPDENTVQHLANALGVDFVIAQLLVQRGVETFDQAKTFFRPQLQDLHDPFLMKDMDKAVQRIEQGWPKLTAFNLRHYDRWHFSSLMQHTLKQKVNILPPTFLIVSRKVTVFRIRVLTMLWTMILGLLSLWTVV